VLLTMTRARALVLAASVVGGLAVVAPSAQAESAQGVATTVARTWSANGRVNAILDVGGAVIIGGEFTTVYSPTGVSYPADRVAKYIPSTGRFDTTFTATANNTVNTLTRSGSTLFVGGDFTTMNGSPSESLAAVDLDTGSSVGGFAGSTNIAVDAMTAAGGWLYVGGPFTTVSDGTGSYPRNYLARIDPATGAFDPTWAPVVSARVRSMVTSLDGATSYVGGDFTTIDGKGSLGRIGKLDPATGVWDLAFVSGPTNQGVRSPALAMSLEENHLLVGAGGSGGGCALLDATTGSTQWSKHATGDVTGAVLKGAFSYCGGHFGGAASFEGLDRDKMASVVTATGAITNFAPNINSALGIFSMGETPEAVFVGGDFTRIGSSAQQGIGMFRDLDALTVPAAPGNLTAIAGDHQVVLSWDVPDTDGGQPLNPYVVYRQSATEALTQVAVTRQPTYADGSARNNTAYTYYVTATNPQGASTLSNGASATPQAGLLNAPSAPRSLTVTPSYAKLTLTWAAPTSTGGSPLLGYRLYRSTVSGEEELLATLDPAALSYVDTAVVIGTRYYYQIAAFNAIGQGPITSEKSGVPATGVPGAPVLTANTSVYPIVLNWTLGNEGAAPVTKYQITRDGVRRATLGAVSSYTDTTALHGVSYVYRIRAWNSFGWGPYSPPITVVVP
jgi:hypothetical protein